VFCYQCEQALQVKGGQAEQSRACTTAGNCAKDGKTGVLQDLLLRETMEMSAHAHRARQQGKVDPELDRAMLQALVSTATNVNFDLVRLKELVREMADRKERARLLCEGGGEGRAATADPDAFIGQAYDAGIRARLQRLGPDLTGLQELLTYGVKGAASNAEHARLLGREDPAVYAFCHEALAYVGRPEPTADELLELCLRCGGVNLAAMELLDAAHTGAYGHPTPTAVRIEPLKGKAILVSGHELEDLRALLQQTAGKGVNVYTHGEMLPAHGYPGLKQHPHLAGNYGGAWQDQVKEFAAFPGAILVTTSCLQPPHGSYRERIFTSGLAVTPGVRHIGDGDFSPVIEAALAAPGFSADGGDKTVRVGYGRAALLSLADEVVKAVRSGALRRLFVIAGCDGARTCRRYYTELAQSIPRDCAILTLACGKYRFNKLDFGEIGGIPRLIDVGQSHDMYSAIQFAAALAKGFGTDVNGLPLSFVLSWFEQKAIAMLLTLLSLGVRDVWLGPTVPAFITPAVLKTMAERFGLRLTSSPEQDLKAMLG
jgi:hydroxylamine reductase